MNTPFSLPNTPTLRHSITPVLLVVFITILAVFFVAGCKQGGAEGKPADVDYYTCTMHPSVKKQSPTDKCPICSMDLTPVKKKGASGHDHGDHSAGTKAPG